jgi:enoyl-CoA hydratase/carnithine racemase
VRIDRPPGNRFNLEVIDSLMAVGARLAGDPRVRVVRLTAAGADFSQSKSMRCENAAGVNVDHVRHPRRATLMVPRGRASGEQRRSAGDP